MKGKRPKPQETLAFDWSQPLISPAPSRSPSPSPTPAPARAPIPTQTEPDVLSVAQLGRVLEQTLERHFAASVWVEGEVSSARPAPSGHVYFALKDEKEDAAIDVVLYRSNVTPRVRGLITDGARIRIRGRPTYWSPRGKLQFVGERVEPTGKGALLEALEKLKAKLQVEGLFAAERKRPLPHDPRIIGVVTSASGAVIHDICKVAFRRGGARILLAPALVQGAGAADSIRRALQMLQKVAGVDVIVVGRGGGSSDDLQAFNDEQLVRDVAASRIPIVSAVGHEVDVTLVDFAADARAATPSQAAEMLVPDVRARRRLLEESTGRLRHAMHARLAEQLVVTTRLSKAFGDPRLLIARAQQRLDDHVLRLERLVPARVARDRALSVQLAARLSAAHPRERIARHRAHFSEATMQLLSTAQFLMRARSERLKLLEQRLHAVGPALVRRPSEQSSRLAARLDAMSPLKVLARGYSIVAREDGSVVRAASEVKQGDALVVRVADGAFEAEVKSVHSASKGGKPPR